MNLKLAFTLEFCIENIDHQKFPPCGHIFNYNPLTWDCQCVFHDQNCELENSNIVADAVYKLTKNNIKRNLGACGDKKKYNIIQRTGVTEISEVKHHVLICIHSDEKYHKQSCQIWGKHFEKKYNKLIPMKIIDGNSDTIQSDIDTFLKNIDDTKRITIVIFCHGTKNNICDNKLKDFFQLILLPIREFANQFLIIDASCHSESHKDQYKLEIEKLSINPDFEIYMYGACKGATARYGSVDKIDVLVADPFLDLILERISYRESLGDKTMNVTDFVKSFTKVTKFSDLEHIFANLHNQGKCCWGYHIEMLRPTKAYDILLTSWFQNMNLFIPVIRGMCTDLSTNDLPNSCKFFGEYKFLEPILGEKFVRKYYDVNLETFELTIFETECITSIETDPNGKIFTKIVFSDETKYKKLMKNKHKNLKVLYMMIEIHILPKENI